MDFIAESLELLPQPVALYDINLKFVSANSHAWRWVCEDVPPEIEDRDEIRRVTGLDRLLNAAKDSASGTHVATSQFGIIHVSRLPSGAGAVRPDLLLASLHAGVDEQIAWLDHQRIVMSLRINENGETTVRALETMLVQAEAALAAQRELLRTYNKQMREFLDMNLPLNTSEKSFGEGLDNP